LLLTASQVLQVACVQLISLSKVTAFPISTLFVPDIWNPRSNQLASWENRSVFSEPTPGFR